MSSTNKYARLEGEELESHLSNYLVSSWSYSSVSCFARNEAEFEKNYIYREPSKRSPSSVAGNAYHKALEEFFNGYNDKKDPSVVELQNIAFEYLDSIPANEWKLQKTTPTVESCIAEATKSASILIESFVREIGVYTDMVDEVLGVEERIEEWLVVNGVDIPLPCHMVIDLIVRLKDGRVVIIDHKSKRAFTEEKSIALTRGTQCMTYVLGYETAHEGVTVDEVWFIENKVSLNRDKSAQVRKYAIPMDEDTRAFYGYILYEPLKRVMSAVSDPDHAYPINYSDTMSDVAELTEFKTRTMMSDIEDFNVPTEKRELVQKRMKKVRDSSRKMISPRAILAFRKHAASFIQMDYNSTNMTNSEKIEHVLRTFGIIANVAHEVSGYSSDTFLLEMSAGTEFSKVAKKNLEIANALNKPDVRISHTLVPYEGRSFLAVEATKKRTEDLMWDESFLDGKKIPLGLDNYRHPVYWDLGNPSTPHMLIGGASGSGKSVEIKSIIEYAKKIGIKNIQVLDPKYDFVGMDGVTVHNDIDDIEGTLASLVDTMQWRVANKVCEPCLVVFDEIADAFAQARKPKQLEDDERPLGTNLQMLLQKGRSSGFRVVAAAQRADTKVLDGRILVNFPVRCCFRVPKKVDSNVILGESGGEMLGGQGDGLLVSPDYIGDPVRFQGFYIK